MNKNEIFDLVSEKEGKYLDLVWYARSYKNLQVDGVAESRTRIEKAHPNETVNLNVLRGYVDKHNGLLSKHQSTSSKFINLVKHLKSAMETTNESNSL